ncbi:MAG: Rep family protein [Microbacterium sp.]
MLALVGTEDDPYKPGGPWSKYDDGSKGSRVFFITQNEHYTDGRELLSEQRIADALARKGMSEWAWIKHDRDVVTEDDVKQGHATEAMLGARKADHFHIVIRRKSHATLGVIARAFGVSPNQVEFKRQGAFWDLVEYLTHENPNQADKGKHVYDRSEVSSNIEDWELQLDEHVQERANRRGGQSAEAKKRDALMLAVMHGEQTLRQVREEEPSIYGKNLDSFKKWRADFLLSQEPPRMRTNHYVGGKLGEVDLGRTGKSQLARLLARALYPHLDAAECYHEAKDKRAPLQHYRGQPVIIWDDYHPVDLMEALGSRTGVWQVFDDHPGADDVKILYGTTRLVHEVNIITRVTPYREYLDALAGQYVDKKGELHTAEDKRQSYGRFPFVHEVTSDEIGVFVNRGYLDDTREFYEFMKLATMTVSMRQVGAALDRIESDEEREAARLAIGDRLLAPVLQQHRSLQPVGDLSGDEGLALALEGVEVYAGHDLERQERDRRAAQLRAQYTSAVESRLPQAREWIEGAQEAVARHAGDDSDLLAQWQVELQTARDVLAQLQGFDIELVVAHSLDHPDAPTTVPEPIPRGCLHERQRVTLQWPPNAAVVAHAHSQKQLSEGAHHGTEQ